MRKRRFTVAQIEALEAAFQQDAYLNEQTKLPLAEIGLNNVQIKNWFQNTRFKRRKSGTDPRLDFDLILGKPASEDNPTPASTKKEDKLTSDSKEDEDKRTTKKENIPTPAPTEEDEPKSDTKEEEEDKPTSAPKEDEDKSTSTPPAVKAEVSSFTEQEV
uniref:Homeobox domain-containing protein n=1 Tax=Panagrolaimus sp. PS1159 TaxID=55785 RepID=A0AC35FH94_9BILA